MFPHVVGAGASLACMGCGARETAPIPRLDPGAYSRACEAFIRRHAACAFRLDPLVTRGVK